MGTINEKINYLNETKELIKQALIGKGVQVSEEDTFRSYVNKISNIKNEEPVYEEITITPSTETQIKEGSFNKVTVSGDENLIPENIKQGVEIFGVEGTAETGESEYNAMIDDTVKNSTISKMITKILPINTTGWTTFYNMFAGCSGLTEIPLLDASKVTNMTYMFSGCSALTEIPLLDTSNVTEMKYMFRDCKKITKVPQLNTSKVTNMGNMFNGCSALTEIPLLDTSNVTDMQNMFVDCDKLTKIPQLNTSKVIIMGYMFNGCPVLTDIPLLDASSVTNTNNMFHYCNALTNFGGFLNLGKGFTTQKENNNPYTLNLSYSSKLTHDSLMNVINNLYDLNLTYDVANGGTLYTQKLILGSTNLAKLTSEEIAIATKKGWTVS